MQNFQNDKRCILTLDAGGTNFVFSALQGYKEMISPISVKAEPTDLDHCLKSIVQGFNQIKNQIEIKPEGISFAFPGPADYEKGIIGDLPNLPAFRGGVALGPFLEREFGIPVLINNDGGLFTLGESAFGLLKDVNKEVKKHGYRKEYQNLIGVTLGTGLGGGIVCEGKLCIGDNSAGGEMWLLRNKLDPLTNAEEGVSKRAIINRYKELSNEDFSDLSPKDVYEIALGNQAGDKQAALKSFQMFGEDLGNAIANVVTLIDGMVVIGGGLSGAYNLFSNTMFKELNSTFKNRAAERLNRLDVKVYNLEETAGRENFYSSNPKEVTIPYSNKTIEYDAEKKIGIGLTKLGTSRAIAIGAYQTALIELNKAYKYN